MAAGADPATGRPVHLPASGAERPRHTLSAWKRAARRAILSVAKHSTEPAALRLAEKLPPVGAAARRLLRHVEGLEVEVCGAPFRLDVLRRSVSRSVYLGGRWHASVVAILRAHVTPGSTVVDVGANVGFMAAHMADRAGPDGLVLAFEPEPRNFALLARNMRRVRWRNVVPIRAAVGDTVGSVRLYLSESDGGDHRIVAGTAPRPSIEVPMTTLDRVVEERRVPVHFVKMDIQGAEAAALRGMRATLASPGLRGIVLEFWPAALEAAGEDPREPLARLREAGLACASDPAAGLDPAAFLASIPPGGSKDLLFLR
jgi:FkbM family methyltransferase